MDTATKERMMPATITPQDEWYAWRNTINTATIGEHGIGVMAAFEQLALRSRKEKRCAECGDRGTVAQPATKYNHVAYWFCDDCDAYWKTRAANG